MTATDLTTHIAAAIDTGHTVAAAFVAVSILGLAVLITRDAVRKRRARRRDEAKLRAELRARGRIATPRPYLQAPSTVAAAHDWMTCEAIGALPAREREGR